MEIKYITNDKIDKQKWNNCISSAENGLIYAYSYYLDIMAKNWDALILNDYEAVMPLTWNKKYGICYLYQPAFTQQLGIFSKSSLTPHFMEGFISCVKKQFRFAEIFLNFGNTFPGEQLQANFILLLKHSYTVISLGFKNDLIKNLKQAEKFNLSYVSSNDYKQAIDLYINEYASRMPHVKANDYNAFRKLCAVLSSKDMLVIRKVLSPSGDLLAIALFLKDKKRLYNVLSTILPAGKTTAANHFLFDQLIKEFATRIDVLDFEGSDIKGVAAFYKKFGAINKPYFFLKYNNLPWPIKYLKK
jgi:hypothetical protein